MTIQRKIPLAERTETHTSPAVVASGQGLFIMLLYVIYAMMSYYNHITVIESLCDYPEKDCLTREQKHIPILL